MISIKKHKIIRYVITGPFNEIDKAWDVIGKNNLRLIRSGPQIRGSKVYANTFKFIAEKE